MHRAPEECHGTAGKDGHEFRVRDKNESQLCDPAHGTPPERAVAESGL
jgi:hypothetical protein